MTGINFAFVSGVGRGSSVTKKSMVADVCGINSEKKENTSNLENTENLPPTENDLGIGDRGNQAIEKMVETAAATEVEPKPVEKPAPKPKTLGSRAAS